VLLAYTVGMSPVWFKQATKIPNKKPIIAMGVTVVIILLFTFLKYIPKFLEQFTVATNVSNLNQIILKILPIKIHVNYF